MGGGHHKVGGLSRKRHMDNNRRDTGEAQWKPEGGCLGLAARSYRQKAEILARFKESNARNAPFFWCALAWHLQTTFPLEFVLAAKLVVLLSTCERESGSESG